MRRPATPQTSPTLAPYAATKTAITMDSSGLARADLVDQIAELPRRCVVVKRRRGLATSEPEHLDVGGAALQCRCAATPWIGMHSVFGVTERWMASTNQGGTGFDYRLKGRGVRIAHLRPPTALTPVVVRLRPVAGAGGPCREDPRCAPRHHLHGAV
jgi:hypothetical protein